MAGSGVTVKVEGWRELSRDFRKMGPAARKELREAIRPAGNLVRDEARRNAEEQGLKLSGTLIRRITVAVNAKGAEVRAGATHKGDATKFPYPRRHEFNGRPFLGPALDEKSADAARIIFEAMDELFDRYGFD